MIELFSSSAPSVARDLALRPPRLVPTWYAVAPSSAIKRGRLLRLRIAGEHLVLFRGREDGQVRAIDAYCGHQGVDLAHGAVVGDRLRCPLHYWEYGSDCVRIKGRERAFTPRYHATERFGMIFVFVGGVPTHPIPGFSLPDEALYFRAGRGVKIDCPWFVPIANAFDMGHLGTVHRRELAEEPVASRPDAMTFNVRYATRVKGHGWSDAAMRLLSGNDIRVDVTCTGGTLITVESQVRKSRGYLMVSLTPTEDGVSILPFFAAPRRPSGLHHLHARISAALFTAFLSRDIRPLSGIRWPDGFFDNDDPTINACYRYLCELPEAAPKEKP